MANYLEEKRKGVEKKAGELAQVAERETTEFAERTPAGRLVKKAGDFLSDALAPPELAALPTVAAPGALGSATGGIDIGVPKSYGVDPISGATINTAQSDAFRGHQMNLVTQLADQAAGKGQSLAQAQMQGAMSQNVAQQFAMANSARGGFNPAAQRAAIQNAGQMNAQAAQVGMQGALAERTAAGQLLGQVAQGARGQDLQVATDQAKLSQDATIQNGVMQIKQAELTAQYKAMGLDAAKAQQLADIEIQKLIQQQAIAQNQQTVQLDANRKAMIGAGIGAVGQGAAVAASDERLKTDVKPGDDKVREFLKAVTVNDYEYKDEKFGAGRFVSPMAQDLLKTELGKSMVVKTDEGLMVDYGKGLGAMLAAQSHLNKRLEALEMKKGKK